LGNRFLTCIKLQHGVKLYRETRAYIPNKAMWCCAESSSKQEVAEDTPEPVKEEEQEPPPAEDPKPKYTFMIVGARGIRNTDWMPGLGKPDCYCEVKLKGEVLEKTPVIDDTMKPRWAYEFTMMDCEDDATLEFKVWDSDVAGRDLLGTVNLKPSAYMEKGCNMEFQMDEAGANIKAYLGLKIKVQGQEEYPEGEKPELEITVEKEAGATQYGLDIDSQDQKHLQIIMVDNGAFKAFNDAEADPRKHVKPSDYIAAVNGVTGNVVDMMGQFQQPKVTVKLLRAVQESVLVKRGDTKQLHGLSFPAKMKHDVLVVMSIGDGYIKEHNSSCKQEADKIVEYDRIVSIKGQTGSAKTLKSLLDKATGEFQIGIQRPCLPNAATGKSPGGMFRFF